MIVYDTGTCNRFVNYLGRCEGCACTRLIAD